MYTPFDCVNKYNNSNMHHRNVYHSELDDQVKSRKL